MASYDIAIVGSGFAGSLMAMVAKRLGYSVILLERGKHPRVTIGESSTPLANLLLEELADRYDLPAMRPLSKWGSWQREYPQVACGLKRGFTFYHHQLGCPDVPDASHANELLVAASPHDRIADTHWYRADFDALLVRHAQEFGVDYVDEVRVRDVVANEDGVRFAVTKSQIEQVHRAKFLIDATGPRGFLQNEFHLPETAFECLPETQALYSHFSGVMRPQPRAWSDPSEAAPYPAEDAAVHHVFDGGWIWVLRFNNGITSAGVAATNAAANRLHLDEGENAWLRLLDLIPALKEQFATSRPEQPFRYLPRLSFLSGRVCGERWAMLPSAAGFVDPLLSTGFPLTLLGIARLARTLESGVESPTFSSDLHAYALKTVDELYVTARLIAALYANMNNFAVFTALCLLYFAAASYSETARRLNKPHLAPSFLLYDHPTFGQASRELLERSMHVLPGSETTRLIEDIHRAIEPFDVAGLTRSNRRNWYPVDAADLLGAASKVESTQHEIQLLLKRCGFHPPR